MTNCVDCNKFNTIKQRIQWIDRMRGLAILSVVVQHLTNYMDNSFVYAKLIGISNMAVFFFVSGYILEKTAHIESYGDAMRFLRKKTIQLALPLIVWQLVCYRYFFSTDWQPLGIADVLSVFTQPKLWFLLTLYGYMFAFVAYRLVCRIKIASGGVKVLFWLLPQLLLLTLWRKTGEFHLSALYLPYFAFGVIVSSMGKENWLADKRIGTLSMLAICLATCFWTSGHTSVVNVAIKLVVSVAVIQIVYLICSEMEWGNKANRFAQKCGRDSLAIYILHWIFLPLSPYHYLLPQNELIGMYLTTVFALIIAYVCCWIYSLVGKFPILKLIMFGQK